MGIDRYLDWLNATIKYGVRGNGNMFMFEALIDEYLRVTYRHAK